MVQPLFLRDHAINTCAGVFILLKLVQYLSRRRRRSPGSRTGNRDATLAD